MTAEPPITPSSLRGEMRKVAAFIRRDWLVLVSYRAALISDWVALLAQVMLFAFISQIVDVTALPEYGGRQPSYLEFATIGIVVTTMLNVGLSTLVSVVNGEQRTGTLEHVLTTPVRLATYQLGSAAFAFVYVPLRLAILIGLVAVVLGGEFAFTEIGPAAVVLGAFVPVVWGLGLASAGTTLTIRRGSGLSGFVGVLFGTASGAYFPITLFPTWLETAMRYNPVTITLDAMRATLLGGAGWEAVVQPVGVLLVWGIVAVALGTLVFRLALRREVRNGTLNLY